MVTHIHFYGLSISHEDEMKKRKSPPYYCNKCGIELKNENWFISFQNTFAYTCSNCNNLLGKKRAMYARKTVINHYSNGMNVCICCGENNYKFLTIDHMNNNGTQHKHEIGNTIYNWLIKNNFPEGFQVLCMNCNWGRYQNGGICPHKE